MLGRRRARSSPPSIFLSYARTDAETVRAFAASLEEHGLRPLLDLDFLQPGQRWDDTIFENLEAADALAVFVSRESLASRFVQVEVSSFAEAGAKKIFPIILGGAGSLDLPATLASYQAIVLRDDDEISAAAQKLAEIVLGDAELTQERSPLAVETAAEASRELSRGIASTIRGGGPANAAEARSSVFLVHGHDLSFRDDVAQHLHALNIRPVILSKVGGSSRSLLDKFETLAGQAVFAVVLMSADDMGASRRQYDDAERGGERTLKFRARENVILELGFFYGRLGWENVFVLEKRPEHQWPDFERPSDLAGVLFVEVSGESDWRAELAESVAQAGLLQSEPESG